MTSSSQSNNSDSESSSSSRDDDDDSRSDNDDNDHNDEVQDNRKPLSKEQEEKEEKEEKEKQEKQDKKEKVPLPEVTTKPKPKKIHRLSLTEAENFTAKLRKRGVIYMARVPPKMTPTKVKSLLSQFAEVTRVYLVEEDATVRKRRKKEYGGSGGKRYLEGWIEFANKKMAKHIAQSLNTTPISNQKRNPHYGDLWNLKYLSKFQWSHLTEKVAYERRVREQKLRVEMMQARRENAAYVQMVETGKKLDQIQERKRKRGEAGVVVPNDDRNKDYSGGNNDNKKKSKRRHKHRQMKPIKEGGDKAAKRALLSGLV